MSSNPTDPFNLPTQHRVNRAISSDNPVIEWRDGKPVAVFRGNLEKPQINDLLVAALSTEYTGDFDEESEVITSIDPQYVGLTNGEVMAIRLAKLAANGNLKAMEMLMDRILGKPKIAMETVNMQMTYQDFLNKMAEEEHAPLVLDTTTGPVAPPVPETIDITPQNSTVSPTNYDDLYNDDIDILDRI